MLTVAAAIAVRPSGRYQAKTAAPISRGRVVLLFQHGEQLVLFFLLLALLETSLNDREKNTNKNVTKNKPPAHALVSQQRHTRLGKIE
jgi:hypothetical protein